ncbi:MAG: aminotransferase class V-fold PLP-dependent enzyme [Cyclobacteriaceae bacterium]|nr:aminotransferase class V-fold PLP-dependent enzyme [Cyclobacteriaceae bacterium]
MTTRRSFFKKTASAAGALSLAPLVSQAISEDISDALLSLNKLSPLAAATDEELWARLAQAYTVSPNILNLNNGGVSPQPKVVQDAVDRYYHLSNEGPSYYMWQILDKGREPLRKKLADLAGVSHEELAINRNTTEALGTFTWGIDMKRGDEIVMAKQDYPNMIHAWKQRELREGVKINWINLSLPIENDETVIKAYVDATTSKTKIWHITHLLTWTGQILPAAKLCAEARKRGIISIVDAAHSFAHVDYKISDLGCDYFGTSLHKWLCAPFGTGLMYINKPLIEKTWPIFPNDKPLSPDIRKFESLGTRSFAPEQAIGQAIDFHNAIGGKRKQERLHYLKKYWCDALTKNPRIKLHISLKPEYSCGLGTFSMDGMDVADIATKLISDHGIHTVSIKWENVNAVRIGPNVYTTTKDLDRFIDAMGKIAAS